MWLEINDWWLQAGVEYVFYIDAHIIFTPLLVSALYLVTKLYKRWKTKGSHLLA